MSTQINVTVERGDLVERAKAEQQKNRRQKLEADNRKKVEAKAKEAKEKAEPPKPEPPLPQLLSRDELAAQRMSADRLSFAWSELQKGTIYTNSPQTRLAWEQSGSLVGPSVFYSRRNNGVYSLRAICGNGSKAVSLVGVAYGESVPAGSSLTFVPDYTKTVTIGTGANTQYSVTAYMSRTFRYGSGGEIDLTVINMPTGGDATVVVGQFISCGYTINMTGNTFYSSSFKPTLAEAQAVITAATGSEDIYSSVYPVVDGIETTVVYSESTPVIERFAAVISTTAVRLIAVPQYFADLFNSKGTKITYSTLNINLGLDFVWKTYQVPMLTYGLNQFRPSNAPVFSGGINVFKLLNDEAVFTNQIQTFPALKSYIPDYSRGSFMIQGEADVNFTDKQMFDENATEPYYFKVAKRTSVSAPFGSPMPISSTCTLSSSKVSTNQVDGTEMNGPAFTSVYSGAERAYCRQMLLALGFTEADLSTTPPVP